MQTLQLAHSVTYPNSTHTLGGCSGAGCIWVYSTPAALHIPDVNTSDKWATLSGIRCHQEDMFWCAVIKDREVRHSTTCCCEMEEVPTCQKGSKSLPGTGTDRQLSVSGHHTIVLKGNSHLSSWLSLDYITGGYFHWTVMYHLLSIWTGELHTCKQWGSVKKR